MKIKFNNDYRVSQRQGGVWLDTNLLLIKKTFQRIVLGLCLAGPAAYAQPSGKVNVGNLDNGQQVSFVQAGDKGWGILISGSSAPEVSQPLPAQFEIYWNDGHVSMLSSAYKSVKKDKNTWVATADVAEAGGAGFAIVDKWQISGGTLLLKRDMVVNKDKAGAGFYSAIRLLVSGIANWNDARYLVPGLIYGEPHTSANAPGGSLNYNAKRLSIREDLLSAPWLGLTNDRGNSLTIMDMAPSGNTTQSEAFGPASVPVIDERLQFGALGAREIPGKGVELGYWLPGTTDEFSGRPIGGGPGAAAPAAMVRRRYNPVKAGFSQHYEVAFRFGKGENLINLERNAWRWAWRHFNPKTIPLDMEVVRRTLADHLADRVLVADDRAGVPFVIDAVSGKPGSFRPEIRSRLSGMPPPQPVVSTQNQELAEWAKSVGVTMDPKAAELELWPKIIMGFCGKNIEVADQLLIESDRDPSPRGQRMRKLALTILESLIRIVPMTPVPAGEGFDIRTGKPSGVRGGPSFSLRPMAEDMRTMIDLIRRERSHGRDHAEWFAWVKAFTDWLLTQQREDGSFPTGWQEITGKVTNTSAATTYSAVPLLVEMNEETGANGYLAAALKAGEYNWTNFGVNGFYLGATGGDVADKESGMLSLEAFLALFEKTKDSKWLERAKAAGDYTENWIWIWNVPMPVDAKYADLGWKPGVPTVGVTGIGSNDPGGVDEYLDWAVPAYARLYRYTHDAHYLDVARILLHDTKSMLALPGRTFDLMGPGWQQEHWRMGPTRGIGAHRTWLPWISVNHLHSITGLEDLDRKLYRQLANGQ